jgi:hypothetical protein
MCMGVGWCGFKYSNRTQPYCLATGEARTQIIKCRLAKMASDGRLVFTRYGGKRFTRGEIGCKVA